MEETILILDFGSQYTQLIARKVRELNVYCEIHPFNSIPEISKNIKGIILSGSPFSVFDKNSPRIDINKIKNKAPLFGVCYGAQLIALNEGADILHSKIREYGRANLSFINKSNPLMKGIEPGSQVWMSHGDTIVKNPEKFEIINSTADVNVAGFQISGENTFGLQFHPEVYHSTDGMILLKNFLVDICKCSQSWTPDSFVHTTVEWLKEKIANDKVVLGISGGVDSSVTAFLLNKAIGKNLHCIFCPADQNIKTALSPRVVYRSEILREFAMLVFPVTDTDEDDVAFVTLNIF